jgi:signal transduction histidine kinase
VDQEGAVRALPPGADLTAYRIIQEALTNVTKHAGTGSALVRLVWGRDRVTITVADDGRGDRATSDRPPGYGLIGMRERATAVGGDLSAGRTVEGGFLVTTHLPLPSTRDATGEPRSSTEEAGGAA